MAVKFVLFLVVVLGIGIGISLPTAKSAAPVQPTASVARVGADTPKPTVIERSASGHFLAVADVNDEPIRFIVDTGADTVALTMEDAERAHISFDPDNFRVIGQGASGAVRGQEVRIADIVLDGKRATDVRAVVLANSDISLLGHTYLRHVDNVSISGDKMTLE